MNRSSGNVSKTKKLISGPANNSKLNRKSFQKLSESSSISSNRNSSAQSEDEVRVGGAYDRPQVASNVSYEEQEQATKKLQAQMKELKHKLRVLEESVDSKDYSLGTMAREKDRAIGEIRRLEKSNKQLRQQLSDERNHYLEEKEKFCEEMTKYKKRLQDLKTLSEGKGPGSKLAVDASRTSLINHQLRWHVHKEKGDYGADKVSATDLKNSKSQKLSPGKDHKSVNISEFQVPKSGSADSTPLYEGDDVSLQMAALRTENAKLRSIICERDEQNYELCLRFLRMKHYKNDIRTRFQDLENEYLQVIANLMDKIDEARQEFNFIIDQKFKKPLHSTNAMYLQLVQRNSRMAFENASLRLENQCLKKELNKYMNGVSDYDRKIGSMSTANVQESKLTLGNSKSESMLRRIKKNVNFKEIRTIYERELAFKNSDTDSNYMTKSSSTVPSNGSLPDQKSNESFVGGMAVQGHPLASFQAKGLPDEILNKIFKRIDTPSSQSLVSGRSKDFHKAKAKDETETEDGKGGRGSKEVQSKPSQVLDRLKLKDETSSQKLHADSKPEIRAFGKATRLSLPSESKESVGFDPREMLAHPSYSPKLLAQSSQRSGELAERREHQGAWREGKPRQDKPKPLRSRQRVRDAEDEEPEAESSFAEFPSVERNRLGKHEKISQSSQEREVLKVRSRLKVKQIKDSCGLQEKFELSDFELPASVESKTQATVASPTDREKPQEAPPRMRESGDEGFGRRETRRGGGSRSLIPAPKIGRRIGDVLREEMADTSRNQPYTDERSWSELCSSSKSGTKTYKVDKKNSIDEHYEVTDPAVEYLAETTETLPAPTRRTEGSKRFSHRLISTSPEQIKSLLTESQFEECYRMAPIIVGHATTEMSQPFKFQESNNEIVLQLVIPTATVGQSPQDYVEEEEKATDEKETCRSYLSPNDPVKNSALELSPSDVRIPVSSLPTSSSTMDMVESAAVNDRNNIMLRTLSAPGLLESGWLDSYSICEMRDCGTNT